MKKNKDILIDPKTFASSNLDSIDLSKLKKSGNIIEIDVNTFAESANLNLIKSSIRTKIYQYKLSSDTINLEIIEDVFGYNPKKKMAYTEEIVEGGLEKVARIHAIDTDQFTHYLGLGGIVVLHYSEPKPLTYLKKVMKIEYNNMKTQLKSDFETDLAIANCKIGLLDKIDTIN